MASHLSKSYTHSHSRCPLSGSYNDNPGHRIEDLLQNTYPYGITCSDQKCQRLTCGILGDQFGSRIIYCRETQSPKNPCTMAACRFLCASLTQHTTKVYRCYKEGNHPQLDECTSCQKMLKIEEAIDQKLIEKREREKKNKEQGEEGATSSTPVKKKQGTAANKSPTPSEGREEEEENTRWQSPPEKGKKDPHSMEMTALPPREETQLPQKKGTSDTQ